MPRDFEEASSLVYIDAVFKESLRLKTTVPYLVFACKVRGASREWLGRPCPLCWNRSLLRVPFLRERPDRFRHAGGCRIDAGMKNATFPFSKSLEFILIPQG